MLKQLTKFASLLNLLKKCGYCNRSPGALFLNCACNRSTIVGTLLLVIGPFGPIH